MRKIKEIIVHCSATAEGNSVQFTQEGNADDVVQVDGLGDLFQDLSERNK